MKLQVAMDVATLGEALALSRLVAEYVDIIELGTLLIKNQGVSAISAVKVSCPDKTIFADMKIVDDGELEADIAFGAGADLVTVMGAADDDTIEGAVASARRHGKGVVADLVAIRDRITRAREVAAMGVEFSEFHAGLHEQARPGYSLRTVIDDGRRSMAPFSVSGGVTCDDVLDVWASGALVAVVGGAIHGAADPRAAAREFRAALEPVSVVWPAVVPAARQGPPHGVPRGVGPGKGGCVRVLGRSAGR